MCQVHNSLNKFLKKPIFDCEYEALKKRWKTGCNVNLENDELFWKFIHLFVVQIKIKLFIDQSWPSSLSP